VLKTLREDNQGSRIWFQLKSGRANCLSPLTST